jgi:hypothetical protein
MVIHTLSIVTFMLASDATTLPQNHFWDTEEGAVHCQLSAESQVVRTRSGADALAQSAELRPELLAPQLLLELRDRLERRLSAQAYETRRVAGTGVFGANRLVLCLLLRSRLRHGETVPSTELCSG